MAAPDAASAKRGGDKADIAGRQAAMQAERSGKRGKKARASRDEDDEDMSPRRGGRSKGGKGGRRGGDSGPKNIRYDALRDEEEDAGDFLGFAVTTEGEDGADVADEGGRGWGALGNDLLAWLVEQGSGQMLPLGVIMFVFVCTKLLTRQLPVNLVRRWVDS